MARIIISLPKELLTDIDAYCTQNRYNRSELIRHAVRKLMVGDKKTKNEQNN